MPPLPTPPWWAPRGEANTFPQLLRCTKERLEYAMRRFGWANETDAAAYLSEEVFLWLDRQTDGWPEVCRNSEPGPLWATVKRLVDHLWAVRSGERLGLAAGQRQAQQMRQYLNGEPANRNTKQAEASADDPPERQVLNGQKLALVLAHILHGDAAMTPIAECQHIYVRLDDAVTLTQELAQQWRENDQTDKATFKRILTQRLRGLMQNPAART